MVWVKDGKGCGLNFKGYEVRYEEEYSLRENTDETNFDGVGGQQIYSGFILLVRNNVPSSDNSISLFVFILIQRYEEKWLLDDDIRRFSNPF